MIYQLFPTKDATIYEYKNETNTGVDALLEFIKDVVTDSDANNNPITKHYPSRVLIKFDYTELSDIVAAGFDTSSSDTTYVLKMFNVNTDSQELPLDYSLQVAMVSSSWEMGTGEYEYVPTMTDGVSWKYRSSKDSGIEWPTAYIAGSTGSYSWNAGGGTWYTSSIVSKSFTYNTSTDSEIDVSDLIRLQLNSSSLFPNDGLIVKRPPADEYSDADKMQLKFFSIDTNTIYLPSLIVKFNDRYIDTGSLELVSDTEENTIYFQNLNRTYTINDRVTFRLGARDKYPVKTFSTSSNYAINKVLPVSSSYSIEDLHTKEIVIPHDYNYTSINCTPTGNYFRFWMGALQPERWYKITIRAKHSNNDVRIYDNNYIFKVLRSI